MSARVMSLGTVVAIDTQQLLRAVCGVAFVSALDDAIGETLTGDYWTQSLVSALETQKARAPAALAFRAAQIVLGTRALFSDQFLRNLLDAARQDLSQEHVFRATPTPPGK